MRTIETTLKTQFSAAWTVSFLFIFSFMSGCAGIISNGSKSSGSSGGNNTSASSSSSSIVLTASPAVKGVLANGTATLSATGGTAPYTYSIVSGTGNIVGTTFTAAGTGPVVTVIKATDSLGNTSSTSTHARVYNFGSPTVWLDADDPTASNTPASDGTSVSTWTNKGTGPNATQAVAAKQPTISSGVQNGYDLLSFSESASQHLVFTAEFMNNPEVTIVTAVSVSNSSTSLSTFFGDTGSASNEFIAVYDDGNLTSITEDTSNTEVITSGSIKGDGLTLVSYDINVTSGVTTDFTLYKNGADIGTISDSSYDDTTTWNGVDTLPRIGEYPLANTKHLEGDIGAIFIYNGGITSTQREIIECFLANKYGLDISSGHTCD